MAELSDFAFLVLIVAGGFALAVLSTLLTSRLPVPAPAIFLLAAAVVSDVWPQLYRQVPIVTVERIAVVALIVILFNGGLEIGWRRFRSSAAPILSLGALGTFATAALIAAFGHYALGFDWTLAGIVGAALAPTDPAVTFSVLGRREIGGRSGTVLEGEAGINDPAGIALMIGMIELATEEGTSPFVIGREFVVEMSVGLIAGVAGGRLLTRLFRRLQLPSEGFYPVLALALAGALYGATSLLHGSGFLAVFITGLLLGDLRLPYKAEIERFHLSLATMSEVVVFVGLGLSVSIGSLSAEIWWQGTLLTLVLALLARPLVVAVTLWRTRLRFTERVFIALSGLKGAVPILLAAFAVIGGVNDADRVYGIVFVVVLLSVICQGTLVPVTGRLLRVPMHERPALPWELSVRLKEEPESAHEFLVAHDSRAAGRTISELPLGERTWITLIVRDGRAVAPAGSLTLRAGDRVIVLAGRHDLAALGHLLSGRSH